MTREAPTAAAGGTHGWLTALTSFVGRTGEVAELAGLLAEYRLVTVTGPAGAGKTRLAGEVARRVAGRFADGVWLTELAGVEDPALVPAAVAGALGFSLTAAGLPVAEWLAGALPRRQLLLVLDNCEQVLAGVARFCGELLGAADDVRVLATSRAPLAVPGEARFRLPSLSLPQRDDQAGLAGSEAVALFADRARRVDPHFAPGPEVAAIVARLDGMPLAIELAAARVEALGVAQLLAGLDDRFGLLVTTDLVASGRQRSLAAAVEWSYRLLGDHERAVFRRLAVIPAPFTLEGALAAAGADATHAVMRLVDCSLLGPPRAGADGRPRYAMLETLRAYGMDRLVEAGELAQAEAALAGHAVTVAEQAAAGLEISTTELAALQRLDAEDVTMHHVLEWALRHEPGTALRLAIALAPWWSTRGRYAAGYELLSSAARHAPHDGQEWCTAQFWLGTLATGMGEAAGLEHFTAARDGLAGHGPSRMLVQALTGRADCLVNLARLAEAAGEASRALELAATVGYPAGTARALYWLGCAAYYAGDHASCVAWWRRAQQIDPATIPGRLVRRAGIALGIALIEGGELAEAREASARVLAMARPAGALFDQADALVLTANIDLLAGRLPEARAALSEALHLAGQLGQDALLIDCLDLCGHLCERTGRPAEALTVWSAGSALRQARGMPDPPADVRRRQGPLRNAGRAAGSDRQRAERRGAAMTLSTAAEYAALLASGGAPEPAQAAAAGAPLPLSARERELVTLVARGNTNAQIAGQLFISVRTVSSHLDRIRDKTGCRRRADLTRLALEAGLV